MKRVVVFLLFLIVAGAGLFAEESVLLNFTELLPDQGDLNSATTINYSQHASPALSDEIKEQMEVSLAIEQWEISLADSSDTVFNRELSTVKAADVIGGQYQGETVLGLRVHFPVGNFGSYATLHPAFEIPIYQTAEGDEAAKGEMFVGKGVVHNVGTIKSISLTVRGQNFPHRVGLVLSDHNNESQTYFFGNLQFEGWKTLSWYNPNYIDDVRQRELMRMPLYPTATPSVRLEGIVFYRDAMHDGGDFVSYIRDINIVYDKAILDDVIDIDDEDVWGIIEERENARRDVEYARLGEEQVLRWNEQQRMHADEAAADGAAGQAAAAPETP